MTTKAKTMRYLFAAIWISLFLIGCDGRDPVVGEEINGDQQTEDGDEQPGEGDQQPGDGDEQPEEGDQQPGDGDDQNGDGDEQPGDGDEQNGDGDDQNGDGDDQDDGDGDDQNGDGDDQDGDGDDQNGDGEQRTEEGDRAQLMEMRREIDGLVGEAAASSISDCRYAALGSKPCGGPWEYIVYSVSSTDSTALAIRLTAYDAFEAEMNERYGYVSDCSVPAMPVLTFGDGRCIAE